VAIKAVDAILYRFLKAIHDQKRNNRSAQSDTNTGDRDLVNRRRKTFLLTAAYSFRYEVRKVQGMA
jgi:hypothetical protein